MMHLPHLTNRLPLYYRPDKLFGKEAADMSAGPNRHRPPPLFPPQEMFNLQNSFGQGVVNRDQGHFEPGPQDRGVNFNRWMDEGRHEQFQGRWNRPGQGHEGQGNFKVPRGRMGHYRTHSDGGHAFHEENNNSNNYHSDDFNINWNDRYFYQTNGIDPANWNQSNDHNKYSRGPRRGSFDGGYENRYKQTEHWLYEKEKGHRGRGRIRVNRNHHRSTSYDNISPGSTSSSDSSLKRRHENDDHLPPGKSRRRVDPPEMFDMSAPVQLDSSLMEDRANKRQHSRSSSMDRLRDSGYGRSETESDSRLSNRKVTWSDQQVSSSTENSGASTSGLRRKQGHGKKDNNIVLPDSSSESEAKKKGLKGRSKKRNTSPREEPVRLGKAPSCAQPKNVADQGNSVLEKAEQLCKKLRSDREKASVKKKEEEKFKKMEKEKELNRKIETLSSRNKSNIKGILDLDMVSVTGASTIETAGTCDNFNPLESTVNLDSSTRIIECKSFISKVPFRPLTPHVNPRSLEAENSSIVNRIAQTKADIDSIRAKIEASVQNEMSQSGSSTDTLTTPQYPKATDRTSLVKMVNSPRTTKERLSVVQMLREHARSQTKLSLPRFNLKFSDLCSGSDRWDEYANINVEALTPDVQLQIANIIEADVKPDISELERLLDQASEENDMLDDDILRNLGINSPYKQLHADSNPSISPLVTRVDSPITRPLSPDRSRSPSKLQPTSPLDMPGFSLSRQQHERRPSPLAQPCSDDSIPERDMPPPRQQYRSSNPSATPMDAYKPESYTTFGRSMQRSPTHSVHADITPTSRLSEKGMPPPRPVLNIEDLKSEHRKSPVSRASQPATSTSGTRSLAASLPLSNNGSTSPDHITPSFRPTGSLSGQVIVKQEKPDDGYDAALGYNRSGHEVDRNCSYGTLNKDMEVEAANSLSNIATEPLVRPGKVSPVRRSVHTQNLYKDKDELPVRDYGRKPTSYSQVSVCD